ncbi:unnamed protein product, partial [Staurois parvus]
MSLLTGERPVLFTHRSLSCQFSPTITECQQGTSGWDPVIDISSHQWWR